MSMCMIESLFYTSETNTLQIKYISIKKYNTQEKDINVSSSIQLNLTSINISEMPLSAFYEAWRRIQEVNEKHQT